MGMNDYEVIVGLEVRAEPVSYTHLDVYKRQMESIPTYIANRHDPSNIRYKTPQLAHILDVTNGCIVYQEQVMQICRELAGFSYGQADLVRRAMAKKKHDVCLLYTSNTAFSTGHAESTV